MCLRNFLWYFLYLCWDEPIIGFDFRLLSVAAPHDSVAA